MLRINLPKEGCGMKIWTINGRKLVINILLGRRIDLLLTKV